MRQLTAGQCGTGAERAVGRDAGIPRECEQRGLVGEQEVEHEAQELGVAGAGAQLLRAGSGGVEKAPGELGLAGDPAERLEAGQLGSLARQRRRMAVVSQRLSPVAGSRPGGANTFP